MTDRDLEGRPTARRALMVVAAAVAMIWLAVVSLAEPELPDFRADGQPLALPASGSIQEADPGTLSQILAGQTGRVVVVNLWASWCAPCRAEMPLLQQAADASGDSVVILGVVSNDQLPDAEQFLADVGVRYPNVFDVDGSIARTLGVSSYPTTFVFGPDGEIRARVDGGISEQRLAGLIGDASR